MAKIYSYTNKIVVCFPDCPLNVMYKLLSLRSCLKIFIRGAFQATHSVIAISISAIHNVSSQRPEPKIGLAMQECNIVCGKNKTSGRCYIL